MKPRELAQLMMAAAALLTAAGSFVKQVRGETAQAVQDQNVAEPVGRADRSRRGTVQAEGGKVTGLLKGLVLRFVKGHWGKLLPMALKAIAEGELGEGPRKIYWFMAGKKTATGAVILGAGMALEAVCSGYPQFGWSCEWSRYVYYAGALLTTVGLVDGGTRAPWPTGTPESGERSLARWKEARIREEAMGRGPLK